MTMIVSTMPRFGSSLGRTAVIRTSSGSVVSNRLNSSVHENVRRSIRSLAWRASADAEIDLLADRRWRAARAACGADRAARASSRDACVASSVSLRE